MSPKTNSPEFYSFCFLLGHFALLKGPNQVLSEKYKRPFVVFCIICLFLRVILPFDRL
jgi:hypothetical protein